MNDEDRRNYIESELGRLLSWISAADAKTSTIFAFATVMLGVLAALVPSAQEWVAGTAAWAAIAAVFLVVSLILSTFAAFPRTTGPKGSMVYFQGIASRKADDFSATVEKMTSTEYLEDLARQCHRNAEIAAAKYTWVRRAMIALYLGVIPWLVAVYHLYQQSN